MKSLCFLFLLFLSYTLQAQERYFTRKGHVSFYSDAPLEKIEAHNYHVTAVLNTVSGEMDFIVLIRSFDFENGTMQEHFNDNYMESDRFPKAVFKGRILHFDSIDLKKEMPRKVAVEGDLTIHGVSRKVRVEGTLEIIDGQIHTQAIFPVSLKDYNITIPQLASRKIAETVEVKTDMMFEPYLPGKH